MFGRRRAPAVTRPPLQHTLNAVATLPAEVNRQAHQEEVLRRFQIASVTRTLALELESQAERARIDADNQFEEARKALRRVVEGAI